MSRFRILYRLFGCGLAFLFVAAALPAEAAIPSVVSAKITGQNTAVVTYSEPVYTQASDYSNFTGALSGRTITQLSGSGGPAINLTFDGGAFAQDAVGGLSIATSTTSVSDGSALGAGSVAVSDGQAPFLSSINFSSNSTNAAFAKAGDALSLSFTMNKSVSTPTVLIGGNTVSVNGNGVGPFTTSYTLTGADAAVSLPIAITATDLSGNISSKVLLSLGGGVMTAPSISSITSDANSSGVLHVGNTITFTVTPTFPEPNASVNGSYNGTPLAWSTSNGGATYVATYTVALGNSSQASPLEISGVTVVDASGNVSPAASGSDVQRTIAATVPFLAEVSRVSTPASSTPAYSFSSSESGTILYGGDCSSQTSLAVAGVNEITFVALSNGLHSNCVITVTDAAGNVSAPLTVSQFVVDPVVLSVPASVAPTTKFLFTRNLRLGDVGVDVRQLQQHLITMGFLKGPVTGRFAAQTQAAVKKFQSKYHLTTLGSVGPATRVELNK